MTPNIAISKIDLKSITRDEIAELVHFHNSYYGSCRKVEDWVWQYLSFMPEKAVFTVMRDHRRLIATQAMMPIYLNVAGERILTGKSENTLLLPQYRGSSLMAELYGFAVECCQSIRLQAIWGFTSAEKAFNNFGFKCYKVSQRFRKLGQAFLKPLRWNWSHRDRSRIRSLVGNWKFFIECCCQKLPQHETPVSYEGRYKVIQSNLDINVLNIIYDRIRKKWPQMISYSLDQRQIFWRIIDHPFLKYIFYQVFKDQTLRACAIVKSFCGYTDVSEILSDDTSATDALLRTVYSDHRRSTIEFGILVNKEDLMMQNTLKSIELGGYTSQSASTFVVRSISDKYQSELENVHNWHLCGLWTEGYDM